MFEKYRGIIIKDGKLLVMKRFKNNQNFYVFPGGTLEKDETEKQCCEREIFEEFGITVKAKNMIYKIKQGNTIQGFFVCDWISGDIHKTDAEEYTSNDINLYGTYEPTTIPLSEIKNCNIYPYEVKNQLLKDIQNFGLALNRPLIEFDCKII